MLSFHLNYAVGILKYNEFGEKTLAYKVVWEG